MVIRLVELFANPGFRKLLCQLGRDTLRTCVVAVRNQSYSRIERCAVAERSGYEQFRNEFQKARLVRVVGLVRLEGRRRLGLCRRS